MTLESRVTELEQRMDKVIEILKALLKAFEMQNSLNREIVDKIEK